MLYFKLFTDYKLVYSKYLNFAQALYLNHSVAEQIIFHTLNGDTCGSEPVYF